jgi:uncharacterized protein YlzI (FlbEa/FlbD family)
VIAGLMPLLIDMNGCDYWSNATLIDMIDLNKNVDYCPSKNKVMPQGSKMIVISDCT